jgi:SAM-dependent methyltransferase
VVRLSSVDPDDLEYRSRGPEDPRFPTGFFDRVDPSPDARFYGSPRLVTHIDRGAIEAVGRVYEELRVEGDVLDLMSSWISHFRTAPRRLVVLGLNEEELRRNRQAAEMVARDLNADPRLPFADGSFDHAVCCVSVDYLIRPVEVFAEVARVLRPGGLFVVTFSDRCFPTKAVRGWLESDDAGHIEIVRRYFELAGGFGAVHAERRDEPRADADPLFAVWAARLVPARAAAPGG